MRHTGHTAVRSLLGASSLLLILSFFFPYWEALPASGNQATGVELAFYLTHSGGPLAGRLAAPEILSRLQYSAAAAAGVALALLALAAVLADRPWVALLSLPAMLLPAAIRADALPFLASAEAGMTTGSLGQLVVRTGTGAIVAWIVAALLAAALLLVLRNIAARRLTGKKKPPIVAGLSVLPPGPLCLLARTCSCRARL
jgi:hypothetical protein